ncbi:aldo/keto reductase [bacterium]|nr:aldo/keto reductase [bacterium]
MDKRILGKTGQQLSVIGFGGIVVMDESPENAAIIVSKAIDRGVNYFDVAPQYGNAQERLGPALKPYRSKIFLTCKTLMRNGDEAETDFKDSLKKLETDYFDAYLLHSVKTIDEVKQISQRNGALEFFAKAKSKGLIRYLGFSAHTEQAALTLMDIYDFDIVVFPVNWACWFNDNFGPKVLAAAQKKDLGIIALKALAKRLWDKNEKRKWPKCWYAPVDNFEEASLALRFTLSQSVTTAISPSHSELLWWACDIADKLTPINEKEIKYLKESSKKVNSITKGFLAS